MSKVLINDGFELMNQSELNYGKVLILNYRLTRDMPIGEYTETIRNIQRSLTESVGKQFTVHINVIRGGRTPMNDINPEEQSGENHEEPQRLMEDFINAMDRYFDFNINTNPNPHFHVQKHGRSLRNKKDHRVFFIDMVRGDMA